MTIDIVRRIVLFIVLLLAQALVFGHVHLLGCATPFVIVHFVVTYPRSYPRWAGLLWAFFLGLLFDVFSNTPGLAAASLTLVAFVQPLVQELFMPRDAAENLKSALSTFGFSKYVVMMSVLVFLFCLTYFSLESFAFSNILQWLMNVGGSTVLTVLVLLVFETLRK